MNFHETLDEKIKFLQRVKSTYEENARMNNELAKAHYKLSNLLDIPIDRRVHYTLTDLIDMVEDALGGK